MLATWLLALLLPVEIPSGTWVGEPFFRDANQGWVVVSSCRGEPAKCRNTLWKTRDGGIHWDDFAEAVFPDSGGIPLEGRLIDESRAILYGTGVLVYTGDGGRSFSVRATTHWIADVDRKGDTLWAVGASDRESAIAKLGDRVLAGNLAGGEWRTLDLGLPPGRVLALRPLGDRDALVLYAYNTLEGMPFRKLLATRDGGKRWSEIPLPCLENAEGLVAPDRSHVWVTCGPDDMPRPDPDHLFTSNDGGRTWKGPVPVPSSGREYALGQGNRAWSASGCHFRPRAFDARGTVSEFRIRDGWIDECDGGFGRVQFSDLDHGWISYGGTVYTKGGLSEGGAGREGAWLFRTVDGGEVWDPILIAPRR